MPEKPAYFRFVTLVAYHAFLSLKVDATILEVGVGGMYDSTNIVPKPIVTGVSALGIDHVGVLGKTLKEIAWQKAGIYKVWYIRELFTLNSIKTLTIAWCTRTHGGSARRGHGRAQRKRSRTPGF